MLTKKRYRPRVKKAEKPIRDAEMFREFTEAKRVYPFWKWKTIIKMVAEKFHVCEKTVYNSIRPFITPQ